MLSRRGFLGTIAAITAASRAVLATPTPKPMVPPTPVVPTTPTDWRVDRSIGTPAQASFKAKRGTFRLGQAVTLEFNNDVVFSGVVHRIDHMPDGDHIFAEDPTPIPFDVHRLYGF